MRLECVLSAKTRRVVAADPALREQIERAASLASPLASELDLGPLRGELVIDDKPRLVLVFDALDRNPETSLGNKVVLKIYGDQPRGEGPLLSHWNALGLPTPRLLHGRRSGCSWLALQYLDLSPALLDVRDRDSRLALTEELAAFGVGMHHGSSAAEPFLRNLAGLMMPRWRAAAESLRSAGIAVSAQWSDRALRAFEAGPRGPLHGDLGLPNIARDGDGRLVVFDPSALAGPLEYDAVRWAVRLSGDSLSAHEAVGAWSSKEQLRGGGVIDELIAAECVLEAGSAIAGAPSTRSEDRARALIATAGDIYGPTR